MYIPTGVETTVKFKTEIVDAAGAYNPATGVYTVPSDGAGIYLVIAKVQWPNGQAGVAGKTRNLHICVNGSPYAQGIFFATGNGQESFLNQMLVSLTAGSTISIKIYHNESGAIELDPDSNACMLTITRLKK